MGEEKKRTSRTFANVPRDRADTVTTSSSFREREAFADGPCAAVHGGYGAIALLLAERGATPPPRAALLLRPGVWVVCGRPPPPRRTAGWLPCGTPSGPSRACRAARRTGTGWPPSARGDCCGARGRRRRPTARAPAASARAAAALLGMEYPRLRKVWPSPAQVDECILIRWHHGRCAVARMSNFCALLLRCKQCRGHYWQAFTSSHTVMS